MIDNPTAPCPVCGTPTTGLHIAGSVFDFTCEPCANETDANFRRFVAAMIDAASDEGTTP